LNPIEAKFTKTGGMTMLKKALVGTIVLGVSALLVAGAINRTSSKSTQLVQAEQGQAARGRQGNAASQQAEIDGIFQGQGRGRQTGGTSETLQASSSGNGNGGGRGANSAEGTQANAAAIDLQDGLEYAGVVLAVDEDGLVIVLESGEELLIEGRTWRYAQEIGFETKSGDSIYLEGYYEGGEFKVISITDITTFNSVVLRSETGKPMWAGGNGRNA
jgi:hypothetical protein